MSKKGTIDGGFLLKSLVTILCFQLSIDSSIVVDELQAHSMIVTMAQQSS